ncbi:TRAP transporter small permease [Ferrovibrio sp.]|uniref:TRAP transporter small permease n=1 Tax=Ferrovibrio sp. TaxID=1917215 RepID=UPI00311D7576
MLNLYRLSETAAAWAARAGALCALLAGLITCADIVIRHAGGEGIIGTVDITQMMIVATAFLTIPYGFIADSHVAVDIGVERLPFRLQALCRAFAALLGALLMAAMGWYGLGQFETVAMMGDRSQTIGWPMTWFWYPLLAGAFFAALMAVAVMLRHLAAAVTGRDPAPAATPPALDGEAVP